MQSAFKTTIVAFAMIVGGQILQAGERIVQNNSGASCRIFFVTNDGEHYRFTGVALSDRDSAVLRHHGDLKRITIEWPGNEHVKVEFSGGAITAGSILEVKADGNPKFHD